LKKNKKKPWVNLLVVWVGLDFNVSDHFKENH
jgi:hypothetical protein